MPTLEKQRTARDLLIDGMNTQGITEVPEVHFEMKDGAIYNVRGETHPVLNRPATDVLNMSFHPSAEGA